MKKKIVLMIIGIILIAIVYGAYCIYQINNPETLFNNSSIGINDKEVIQKAPDDNEDNETAVKSDVVSPKGTQPEQKEQGEEEPYHFDSERLNILLLGIDASTERYETMKSFRTDTIMLVSINFHGETVQIISIPRDSYVQIPGREQKEKINAAFVRGGGFHGSGFERTMETVAHFLGGISVDYYMAVDMSVVKEIIDIMGGLHYEVDVDVMIGGRTLNKGFQHLNGQQVLDYARTRHTGKGDIDRIGRQQRIILAVFDQLKSTKQIPKIPQLYSAIMDRVHTNMNLKQITALALFATKLRRDNIQTYTIAGGFVNLGGISYWGVDQNKKKELVSEIFGMDIEVDSAEDIKYLKEKMEEQRDVWMKAVKEGQAAVNVGNGTLVAYGEAIKEDEKAKLESSIRLIMEYIDEGDMEGIYKWVEELYGQNGTILPLALKRYGAIQNAQAMLADVSGKVEIYQTFLLEDEKTVLQGKVDIVEQCIEAKEAQAIEQAVKDLESYADTVFNSCEQRKSRQEASERQDKTPQQQEDTSEQQEEPPRQQQEDTSNQGEQAERQEQSEAVHNTTEDETSSHS